MRQRRLAATARTDERNLFRTGDIKRINAQCEVAAWIAEYGVTNLYHLLLNMARSLAAATVQFAPDIRRMRLYGSKRS
jgi:hypothetical protein